MKINGKRPTRAQLNRGWYRISNASGADEKPAQVHLYDEIGYWGMSAGDFIDQLKGVSATSIELRVNSPGGEIFDGFAIYNALAAHPAEITAYVDALAASAASFIVQAADKIIVQETSQMMIHDGIGFAFGNAADMRALAAQLDQLSGMIANIYAARSGTPIDHWREAMQAETWYTAAEAVDAGLADEVLPMKRREEGAQDKTPAPFAQWDLSPFRFAGRNAAPAPTIVPTHRTQPDHAPDTVPLGWLLQDDSSAANVDADAVLAALRG